MPPLRLISLQPGLQVMLKTRKELESVSATLTLDPSGMSLTVVHSPAAIVTDFGASVPTMTSNVNRVPAVTPLPADLAQLQRPDRADVREPHLRRCAGRDSCGHRPPGEVDVCACRSRVAGNCAHLRVRDRSLEDCGNGGAASGSTDTALVEGRERLGERAEPRRRKRRRQLDCIAVDGDWIPLFACAIAASTLEGATRPLSTLRSAASSC